MPVQVDDLVEFTLFGHAVLLEVYTVDTIINTYGVSGQCYNTELVCTFDVATQCLHAEVSTDGDYDNLKEHTFRNVTPFFMSDNMTKAENDKYALGIVAVTDMIKEKHKNATYDEQQSEIYYEETAHAHQKPVDEETAHAHQKPVDEETIPSIDPDSLKVTMSSPSQFIASSTTSNPYVRRTEVDNEIYLVQTAPKNDPMIHFGPLSIRLSDLMHQGFDLTVLGYRTPRNSERRATLYLTRKGEQYKICRKFMHEFLASDDLSEFVKEQNLTHKLNLNVEYKEIPFTVVERPEPFEALLTQYPSVKSTDDNTMMIGNRTLREHVRNSRIRETF